MSERVRGMVYESGQWQAHLGRRELLAGSVPVPIGARAFEIVEVLVRSANELLTPGAAGGENTLQVHISAIRQAPGQDRAGALFWELRVALSLARLRMTQRRDVEARRILQPVYDRFTEGFEAVDLQAARAMPDALPS